MEPALDSENPLRLAAMTEKSLALFQREAQKFSTHKPFFLLLEASQIDWCGHANDIACAMAEMEDMAVTMKIIKQFIDKNPNTIFVATADHSTGGLSLGAKGQYQWNAATLKNVKATAPKIARQLLANKNNWRSTWQTLTQIKLADDEQKALDAAINQTDENANEITIGQVTAQVLVYIDKYTATGWTTKGHTGEDVQIFSYGKNKQHFNGAMDNTDVAKKLMSYLNP